MESRVACVALLWLGGGLILAGEGSPYEQSIQRMLKHFDEIGMILKGIDAEEDAAAAKPNLKKAADAWTAARDKAAKLQPPERAEKDRLTKIYKPKIDAALVKIYVQVPRVEAIPGGRDALKEIAGILRKDRK